MMQSTTNVCLEISLTKTEVYGLINILLSIAYLFLRPEIKLQEY